MRTDWVRLETVVRSCPEAVAGAEMPGLDDVVHDEPARRSGCGEPLFVVRGIV